MIALQNGKTLITGTGITKQSYNMRITGSVIVSILCFVKNRTDSYDYRYTLHNGQYIRCYTESGNMKVQGYNSDDTPIPRYGLTTSLSNFDIPVPVFLVQEEGTQNIYLQYGSLGITSIGQLESEKPVNATLVQYPSGQPIDRTVKTYLKAYNWTEFFTGTIVDDENDLDGNTGTGGGGGTHDATSDFIGVPSLPSFSIFDYGMMSAWGMTSAWLKEFASYLWDNDFIQNIRKIWDNPMENVLSLSIMPVDYHVDIEGHGALIEIGNVRTTAHGDFIDQQFYEVDLGTLDIEEHFGSFLDYSPNTQIELYIPYCTSLALDVDAVMNTTLGVKLHIDILTGELVAFVTSDGTIIATTHGNCKVDIPISATNYSQQYSSFISAYASFIKGTLPTTSPADTISEYSNAVGSVMSAKMNYETASGMGLSAGLMGLQYAFVSITYPRQALPSGFKKFRGYPSYITEKIENLTGYTEIYDIKLNSIPCTEVERERLLNKMKGGFIL